MRADRALVAAFVLLSSPALLTGCGGGGGGGGAEAGSGGTPRDVQVSWAPNRERAVNSPGGGYRVYYSTTPGFDIASAPAVDVPYTSGPAAPTSTVLESLAPGTYYIKVVAYSSLEPPGGTGGSTSAPSAEVSITVP